LWNLRIVPSRTRGDAAPRNQLVVGGGQKHIDVKVYTRICHQYRHAPVACSEESAVARDFVGYVAYSELTEALGTAKVQHAAEQFAQ
jgi:hypothetical protein